MARPLKRIIRLMLLLAFLITTSVAEASSYDSLLTLPSNTSQLAQSPSSVIGSNKTKRWYGITESNDLEQESKALPWPRKCSPLNPIQPIRYCYKNKRSADNLEEILNHAIARWAPAMQNRVSALSIDLDHGDDIHVYCDDPRVEDDALVISDETRDGDEEWNWEGCETQTSVTGYDYGSTERGRHTLEFCHLKPGSLGQTRPFAIRAMMHELGHAIGLQHEHQRPDRGKYLWYKAENLEGFDQAQHLADIDEQAMWDDDTSMEDKIKDMSQIQEFAEAYFPQALPFIAGPFMKAEKWQHYVHSEKFDFESIMIYNSDSNTIKESKFVIWRKTGEPVWMGGSQDPVKASISVGDIARVAQLYPSGTEEGKKAQDLQNWGAQKPLAIKIRDAFETVIYAPNLTLADV